MLQIQQLTKRYGEKTAVDALTLTIRPGEIFGFIGPNGAGKTLIADVMQRKFALKEGEVAFGYEGNVGTLVKSIAFKDIYSLAD